MCLWVFMFAYVWVHMSGYDCMLQMCVYLGEHVH